MNQSKSLKIAQASSVKIQRILSIDILRGLVMILMALDHIRSFFSNATFRALDLAQTNVALFLTRWITHLCAPTFIFLAGVGVYLSSMRGKNKQQIFYFLVSRGLWLIFLEFTIVRFGWTFNLSSNFLVAGVLWAIGWSMIILAPLIYLPVQVIGILGILIIAGHNLFDSLSASQLGGADWLWATLHEPKMFQLPSEWRLFIQYPLIPWVGVMATGYAAGTIFELPRSIRKKLLQKIGMIAIVGFFLLRLVNIYGDPQPWSFQADFTKTILSFLNCEKYPPSLQFLLITLGIAIFILGSLETDLSHRFKFLAVFGQVPLFFYLIHLWLIHIAAIIMALPQYGWSAFTLPYIARNLRPENYGYELISVYFIWLVLGLIFYPICRWFYHHKRKHRYWLLNYL